MATTVAPENYFLIDGSWELYEGFLEAIGERSIRVTFDGTMMGVTTPSNRHEGVKSVLRMLLECYMEVREIEFQPGGNTTFKRVAKKKGLERGAGRMESDRRPSPDLCLEVEVSRSVLDRVGIYSSLGVPEVWRVSEQGKIRILALEDGSHSEAATSPALPKIDLEALTSSLQKSGEWPGSRIVREYRKLLTS